MKTTNNSTLSNTLIEYYNLFYIILFVCSFIPLSKYLISINRIDLLLNSAQSISSLLILLAINFLLFTAITFILLLPSSILLIPLQKKENINNINHLILKYLAILLIFAIVFWQRANLIAVMYALESLPINKTVLSGIIGILGYIFGTVIKIFTFKENLYSQVLTYISFIALFFLSALYKDISSFIYIFILSQIIIIRYVYIKHDNNHKLFPKTLTKKIKITYTSIFIMIISLFIPLEITKDTLKVFGVINDSEQTYLIKDSSLVQPLQNNGFKINHNTIVAINRFSLNTTLWLCEPKTNYCAEFEKDDLILIKSNF